MNKPYSEACEQNREPILSVIKPLLADFNSLLEIGSGTGQHAAFFAAKMPHLVWQPSDVAEFLPGIRLWVNEAALPNLKAPIELDVLQSPWPNSKNDTVFSANTAHIMHWPMVEKFFAGVGQALPEQGLFTLYGPFNYDQQYTSASNAQFDQWLKARDPQSGIRDFEAVNQLAENAGMRLKKDYAMPANNRILCWEKL